ncbi:hypothetical protein VE03_07787 [Pseudogymnoascus sp. 23342-1-I1]|nr:hypothetical protein VE03_07787 [Pseudogymnoascus sp. 23342-1-I1]
MLPIPFKGTDPTHLMNGEPTPDETIYASASKSAVSESNESQSPYNKYGFDIFDDEELDEEESIKRSMARRKRSVTPEAVLKKCREPGCAKEFKRQCDLDKHQKTHSRPWKCHEPLCKYHEYGWPTEKELDRHANDKHPVSPGFFKCLFPPCTYQSKRESNFLQHMGKSHGWLYMRSKNNVTNHDQTPKQQHNALFTHFHNAGLFDPFSNDDEDLGDTAGYQADDSSKPVKHTADYLREQHHTTKLLRNEADAKVPLYPLDRYVADFDDWFINYGEKLHDAAAYDQHLSRATESNKSPPVANDQEITDILLDFTPDERVRYYDALLDLSTKYEAKIPDATGYQPDIPVEPLEVTTDLMRGHRHAIDLIREEVRARHFATLDDKLHDAPAAYQTDILGEPGKPTADSYTSYTASFDDSSSNHENKPGDVAHEPVHASSSPSGPALHLPSQGLSGAPESNGSHPVVNDQNSSNIRNRLLRDINIYPASFRDEILNAVKYEAGIEDEPDEPVTPRADILRVRQHVETTPGLPGSYSAGFDDSSSTHEHKLRDTSYEADIMGDLVSLTAHRERRQERQGRVEVTHGPRASYSSGLFNSRSNYGNKGRDDSSYQTDIAVSYGRRAGHYSGLSNLQSNSKNTHNASSYQVDVAGEPAKLTAGLLRRQSQQRPVKVTNSHHASYDGILSSPSSTYADKARDAAGYQAYVSGEPVKLTADLLRKQQNTIGSSRSTHSSSSRDESDFKRSLTTRTTRTVSGDATSDDVTIRIKGNAKVTIGTVEITNADDSELNIVNNHRQSIRDGSEASRPKYARLSDKHKEGDSRRRGNPYASSLNTKPRENRRKVLRVRIKDKDHLACPDSGSEKNIISKACAVEHGFRIRRKAKDKKRFEVGNGDIVWSIGRVSEIVRLPGSPLWQKKRWFYVLDNCPVPLVMGMKFLREAEILTKYRHLLENCPVDMSNISSLLWIGSPRNRLRCTIDGRQLVAAADTGSDLNLMSLECAEREGFQIDRRMEARAQIVVGSGKVIETLGQVYVSNLTLDWREAEAEPPERPPHIPTTDVTLKPDPHKSEYPLHREGDDDLYTPFHVVKHLPCDIVFGERFLHDTDAFNKCPELLDIPPTKQNRQFEKNKQQFEFMILRSRILPHISFLKKPPKLPIDLREQHDNNWHDELYRRSKNTEEKIALLPPGEQEAARRTEAIL